MDLSIKKCLPISTTSKPFSQAEAGLYLSYLKSKWDLVGVRNIQKEYLFKDFKDAIEFVNKIANLAEAENHHPDIHISYNKVSVKISTHSISGLSENDFILASKIEKI